VTVYALPRAIRSAQVSKQEDEKQARKEGCMRILLYNPDNGVTRNFMPHLWMFLLKALTPAGH